MERQARDTRTVGRHHKLGEKHGVPPPRNQPQDPASDFGLILSFKLPGLWQFVTASPRNGCGWDLDSVSQEKL